VCVLGGGERERHKDRPAPGTSSAPSNQVREGYRTDAMTAGVDAAGWSYSALEAR
jgi:hypothetical protein